MSTNSYFIMLSGWLTQIFVYCCLYQFFCAVFPMMLDETRSLDDGVLKDLLNIHVFQRILLLFGFSSKQ